MFDNILKYQELERQLMELDNEINNCNAKKQVSRASAIVKDEQGKLRQIIAKSEFVQKDYESNLKKYDKYSKEVAELLKSDTKKLDDAALNKLVEKVNELGSIIEGFMRALSVNNKDADNISREFDEIKKKINDAKVVGSKAKEQLNALNATIEPKKKVIETQLSDLEKTIDKGLLGKYKKLREDNIFPVFVPLLNDKCGGCRTDVSSAFVNKLKASGYLECEQCGKLVFLK
ncbi:MAG: hypothetical protein LBN07_03440 [Christensenellaceae bacterium]|nr:hypothetical protein [Christensenellaceae bacterium]